MHLWLLEYCLKPGKQVHRQPLIPFPFTIGREDAASLTIPKPSVSKKHSRIEQKGNSLTIIDLHSRNGTFINYKRIHEPTVIRHGDIIHIGDVEMRLIRSAMADFGTLDDRTMTVDFTLSKNFPTGVRELEEMMVHQLITPVYQPIVDSEGSLIVGYELLGRGASKTLPQNPKELFHIAESVGLEAELSKMMRNKGIEEASKHQISRPLFVNTHPAELNNIDALLESLKEIRRDFPLVRLVLEINEEAITDADSIKILKRELLALEILLAYDDFGVGQSRLLELVEATPHVLKFDISLIHHIDQAVLAKRELLKQLHRLSKKLRIKTLAECVGTREEYTVCQSMGFDLYQGNYFGKPVPVAQVDPNANLWASVPAVGY